MAYTSRLNRLRSEEEERALDEALNIIGRRGLATSAPRAVTRSNSLALADELAAEQAAARRQEEARLAALQQFNRQQYNAEMKRRQEEEAAAEEAARRQRQEELQNVTFNRGQDVSNLDVLRARARMPQLNNVQNLSLERAIVDLNMKRQAQREAQQRAEEQAAQPQEKETAKPREQLETVKAEPTIDEQWQKLLDTKKKLDSYIPDNKAEQEQLNRQYAELERQFDELQEEAQEKGITGYEKEKEQQETTRETLTRGGHGGQLGFVRANEDEDPRGDGRGGHGGQLGFIRGEEEEKPRERMERIAEMILPDASGSFRRSEEARERGTGEKTKGSTITGDLRNEQRELEEERRELDDWGNVSSGIDQMRNREYAELERDENRLRERAEKERETRKTAAGMSAQDAMRALDEIEREHEQFISKRTPTWMLELEQQETQQDREKAEAALAKDPEAERQYRTLHDYSVYKPVNVVGQNRNEMRKELQALQTAMDIGFANDVQNQYAQELQEEITRKLHLTDDVDGSIAQLEKQIAELDEMTEAGGYFTEGTAAEKIKAAKQNLQKQIDFYKAWQDAEKITEDQIERGKLISEGKGEKLTGKIEGTFTANEWGGNKLTNTNGRSAQQVAFSMAMDAAADLGGGKGTSRGARKTELGRMTERERNLYYAYLAMDEKDGGNRAEEYRTLMKDELARRDTENYQEYIEGVTETAPVFMKGVQSTMELAKPLSTGYDVVSRLAGNNTPYSPMYFANDTQNAVNETVSKLIDERVKDPTWNKVVHVLDEAGTNIINNGVRNVAGSIIGLGPVATTVAMGLGEAGGAARETTLALEEDRQGKNLASLTPGEDSRQAVLKGAFSALGEMAGEFLPTEHWFGNIKGSTQNIGQFLINVLKQTATEIPGEVLTDVIDKAADNYIMKDKSEDAELKRKLVYNGVPEDEADRLIRREFGRQILNTVMVTALSSGASSAYTQGVGNSRVNKAQRILDDYCAQHGIERIRIEGLDDLYAEGTRQTYEAALEAANNPDVAENSYSTPEAAEAAAEQQGETGTADEDDRIAIAIQKAMDEADEQLRADAAAAAEAQETRENVKQLADEILYEKVKPATEEQIRERDREMERNRGRAYVQKMTPEEEAEWIRQQREARPIPATVEENAPGTAAEAAPAAEGQTAETAEPAEPATEKPGRHIELKTKAGKEIAIDQDDEGTRTIKDEAGEHVEFDTEEDPDSSAQVILRKTHGKSSGETKAVTVAVDSANENQDKDSVATEAAGAYTAGTEGREISQTAKETIYSELTDEQLRAAEEQGRKEREERERLDYETTKRNTTKYGFRLADNRYHAGANIESLSDENAADGAKRLQMMALDEFGKAYGIDIRVHNTLEEGKANAKYRIGSGVINVALDAEDGGILRAASHDLYHYIRDWAAESADKVKAFVLDTLAKAQDYNLELRRAELQAENERNGIEEDVDEEIVADAMLDVIGREGVIAKVFGDDGRGGGIVEKIKEGIDKFRNFLHSVLNRIGRNNKEAAALKDDEAYMDRLAVLVDEATKDATARRREKERARAITEKKQLGKYTQQDLIGIARAVEEARETGEETAVDDVLTAYGAFLLQETDDAEEGRDKRKKVKRLFEALDDGQNLAKAAETAELDLTDEQRTFFGWAQRERTTEETVERERQREKRLPVKFEEEYSRKEEQRDPDGETAKEWVDSLFEAERETEEEQEKEAWKTRRLFTNIVNLMKYGRKFANDEGTPNVGEWTGRVDQIVSDIKHRGFSTIGDDALGGMIRKMYTALDDTIARGGNITPTEIFNYAEEIAEKVAKKARYANESAESEDKSDFRKFLHETVFRINPELKDYVKSTYGGIWNLNKEFRGITSFSWNERGNTYDKEGHRKGTHPIDDLYTEGWRGRMEESGGMFDQAEIPNREDQLDHFLEMARWAQKEETTYSWAGMTEDDYIDDITNAIVMDYLDLGVDKMLQGTDEKQLDKYRAMSRNLQAQYRQAKKKLEQQAREELAAVTGQNPAEIDLTKKEALKEKYTAQIQALANQYAQEARTEAQNMQLEAARQMDEANEVMQQKGPLLAEISNLRTALHAEHESRELEWQAGEEALRQSVNEEIRRRAERTGIERNIKRNITNMQRRLQQPNDKMHIADEYRGGIANALKLLGETIFQPKPDAKTGWTYAFSTLRDVIARLSNETNEDGGSALDIDPDLVVDISNLEEVLSYTTKDGEKKMRRNWRSMSTAELKQLDDVIDHLRHMIDHADEAHKLAKDATISSIAEELHGNAQEKESDKTRNDLAAGINRYLNKTLRDPVRYFKEWSRRIGGESGGKIWKALRASLDTQIRDTKKMEDLFAEALNNTDEQKKEPGYDKAAWDIRRWTGKGATALEVELDSGEKVHMTPGQLMYVYLAKRRLQAQNHILGNRLKNGERVGGGISIGRTVAKNGNFEQVEPVKVTENDLARMEQLLTDEQKTAANRLSEKIFNGYAAELGNEVSKNLYGYTKFKEANYIPIRVYEGGKSVTGGTENGNPFYRIKNQGFTKQLVQNANAPLQVMDLFDIAAEHAVGMVNYHAWTETVSDLTRLLNYKFKEERLIEQKDDDGQPYTTTVTETVGSVAQDIQRVLGKDGKAYLMQLLKDINGLERSSIEAGVGGASRWFSRFKAAAVAYNVSTVMKQPLSVVRAFDTIPMHYFRGANVLSKTERERIQNDMTEYAPIFTWKQYGNFMMDTGKSAENIFYPQLEGFAGKASEAGMWGAGQADNLTWMNIWRAAERMIKAQREDLRPGTAEYKRAVAEKFNECIDETQVVDSLLHRTEIMRSPSQYLKMITSFMGEPLKTFNTFMDKANQWMEDRSMKNMRELLKTGTVLTASGALTGFVSALMGALRHWDEGDKPFAEDLLQRYFGDYKDKNWIDTIIEAFIGSDLGGELNPLNSIPLARDLMEAIAGYDVERTDVSSVVAMVDAAKALAENLSGKADKTTLAKRIVTMAGTIANLTGLPVSNITKELLYGSNELAQAVEANGGNSRGLQYLLLRYNKTLGTSNKNEYIDLMIKAQEAGDEKLANGIMQELLDAGVTDEQINTRMKNVQMGKILGEGESVSAENAVGNWYQALKAGDRERAKEIYQGLYKYYKTDTISGAIAAAVKNDPRTTEVNRERMKGNNDPMQKWLQELRNLGVDGDLAMKGINNNFNALKQEDKKATAAPSTAPTKKPEVSADVAVFTYSDLYSAISAGTDKDAQEVVKALRSQGKKDENIRTQVTKNVKPEYLDAYKRGDQKTMRQLETKLLGLGIGYTAKSFETWIKDYEKQK